MTDQLKCYTVIGVYTDQDPPQRFATTVEATSSPHAEELAKREAASDALVVAGVVEGSAVLTDIASASPASSVEVKAEFIDEPSALLLSRLRALRIRKVTATWHGSGDEGSVQDVTLFDESGRSVGEAHEYGGNGSRAEDQLASDLSTWMDELIYQVNPGWEINEGGGGTLEFDTDSNMMHFGHYFYPEPEGVPQPFKINMLTGEVNGNG